MLTLSTTIHKLDNLKTFQAMLRSVKGLATEINIYAMEMKESQQLKEITAKYKANIIHVKPPPIVEVVRNRQIKNSKNPWVLVLDFDEQLAPSLKKEIKQILKNSPEDIGSYALRRQNYSLGHRLRYGGWGDDYQVRLIHKPDFINWPNIIHAVPEISGKQLTLNSPLLHKKDESLVSMVEKTNRYSDSEAKLFYEGKIAPVKSITLLRKMNMEILRRGVIKKGLLDGLIGIIQSIYQGFSVFITYAKLYELQIKQNPEHGRRTI